MFSSAKELLEVAAMLAAILGVVPASVLGSWCAENAEAKIIWLATGILLSAILLAFSCIMRYFRSKEHAEKMAAAKQEAQEVLNKAKALMSGMGMRVCGDGVLCEPEVHDRALARLALELGAKEKPLVPPAVG